jgi:NADH-quinone oxidoreductase subunit M
MYSELNINRKLRFFFRFFLGKNILTYSIYRVVDWYLKKRFSKISVENYINFFLDEDVYEVREYISSPFIFTFGVFAYPSIIFWLTLMGISISYFPMELSDILINLAKSNPIFFLIFIPLISIIFIALLPAHDTKSIKYFSFYSSILNLLVSLFIFLMLDLSVDGFQFQFQLFDNFFSDYYVGMRADKPYLSFIIGLDVLSSLLICLNNFLLVMCLILNWQSTQYLIKENNLCFHVLSFFICMSFISLDIIMFYAFFEATLVPLFIIIGVWGSRERKVYASYKLFFYTLVSSILTFIGIILLITVVNSGNFLFLSAVNFSNKFQNLVWFLMFLSFAVKLPMIPFHLWLPEAHVEASTSGSIVLAGIVLKLGGFGFFRFLLPMFPGASVYYSPLILLLSLLAIAVSAVSAVRQIDLKKIIAYSSVSHMGFVTLAFASFYDFSFISSVWIMFGHGLVSSVLFALIGILYDRYGTKLIFYYKGLATVMPVFAFFFLFFILANIGLPGTINFIGEFLTFLGIFKFNLFAMLASTISIIVGTVYSVWLFNRIFFGAISTKFIKIYSDILDIEVVVLSSFFFLIIFFGVIPYVLSDFLIYYSSDLYFFLFKF